MIKAVAATTTVTIMPHMNTTTMKKVPCMLIKKKKLSIVINHYNITNIRILRTRKKLQTQTSNADTSTYAD